MMMMMMMMTTIIQSFLPILLQHTQLYSPFEKAAQLYAKKMKVNNLTLPYRLPRTAIFRT